VIDTRTHTTVLFFTNSDSIERCLDILCLHMYKATCLCITFTM